MYIRIMYIQVAAPQLRTVGGKIVIDTASLLISNAPDRSHELADVVLDQVLLICFSNASDRSHELADVGLDHVYMHTYMYMYHA